MITSTSKKTTSESTVSTVISESLRERCCKSRVRTSRLLFVLCLCVVAGIFGFLSDKFLTESEKKLAEEHYDATAERALNEALAITLRKRLGVKSLATMMSYTFPDAATWPNVSMKGFEDIAESVIDVATGRTMGLCPFVTPDQLSGFEDFAYNVAFTEINDYPNSTGLRDFAGNGTLTEGVLSFDEQGNMYRETNGTAIWGSPHDIICPFIMHSAGPPILMLNLHSVERFGKVIDEVIECANNNVKTQNAGEDYLDLNECAVLSNMMIMHDPDGVETGPSALIVQPIYPVNDHNLISGIVHSTMQWSDVLATLFSTEVSGVDCVLGTETLAYTYHVDHGVATLKGRGDLHDPHFSKYRRSIDLYSPGLFSYTSASYTLTLYPTDELFEVYSTKNPTIATVGSVCIVLFTASLFFLYDFFVRQEFHQKQAVMDAKRHYMRFISHEVRTPLSTIIQGCQLLQQELTSACPLLVQQGNSDSESTGVTTTTSKLRDWNGLVSDVFASADSAVNVLSDILNYDRIESGTLHLELSIVPIWSLIRRTADEFRPAAQAKTITYMVDFSPLLGDQSQLVSEDDAEQSEESRPDMVELPDDVGERKVIGDKIRITQILRNLLSNAIKFTPQGGDITVRTTWQRATADPSRKKERKKFVLESGEEVSFSPTGYVEVNVEDSGVGMSEEQVEKVFNEGVQFNVNRLQAGQGSGLGLYIATGIAEQHGGHLEVATGGIGLGTTFKMVLPLFHVPDTEITENLKNPRAVRDGDWAEADGEEKLESSEDPLGVFRILVVDDTLMNRKMLLRLLGGKGHICDQAENGLIAVEMVERAMQEGRPYDSILLDYEMPVMKGPPAAARMRDLGCSSFIVGVTGNVLPEDIEYFTSQGANCVLPKPLKLHDLEATWIENGISGG